MTSLSVIYRKAHLILRRTDRMSLFCRSLLRSGFIQSQTENVSYMLCRSEDSRSVGTLWHSSLHESRLVCLEKLISVQRNIYGKSKLRWDEGTRGPSLRSLMLFYFLNPNEWLWDYKKCFQSREEGLRTSVWLISAEVFTTECKNVTAWRCCRTQNQEFIDSLF